MPFVRVDPSSLDIDVPSWIIGFIEGEGSFTESKAYPVFQLGQGDVYTLSLMKEFFGVGSITYDDSNHFWTYKVCGRKCWLVRNLCEGKLLIGKKREQFENWKKLKWLPPPEMTSRSTISELRLSDWLRGFIEAEGSFTRAQKKYPQFTINQTQERDIFDRIKVIFGGYGSIARIKGSDVWQYTVSYRSCWIVRDFCEGKLVSLRRRKQFEDWKALRWANKPSIKEFVAGLRLKAAKEEILRNKRARPYVSQVIFHEKFVELILKNQLTSETRSVYKPLGQRIRLSGIGM